MGPIAAIGIIKGKPFAPDARMKKILTEALALANATSRTLFMAPRDPDLYYYPGSGWQNMLFEVGYEFETPIPLITPEAAKPFPPTGYRTLDARTDFFYGVTGITLAMAMRLPGIGSTYLWTMVDAKKEPFDGTKTYKVTLPKDIPQANFWSFTLYDNMSRSMLDTPQRYPRAGSKVAPICETFSSDKVLSANFCSALMARRSTAFSIASSPTCPTTTPARIVRENNAARDFSNTCFRDGIKITAKSPASPIASKTYPALLQNPRCRAQTKKLPLQALKFSDAISLSRGVTGVIFFTPKRGLEGEHHRESDGVFFCPQLLAIAFT
jgi:hypothetical protein